MLASAWLCLSSSGFGGAVHLRDKLGTQLSASGISAAGCAGPAALFGGRIWSDGIQMCLTYTRRFDRESAQLCRAQGVRFNETMGPPDWEMFLRWLSGQRLGPRDWLGTSFCASCQVCAGGIGEASRHVCGRQLKLYALFLFLDRFCLPRLFHTVTLCSACWKHTAGQLAIRSTRRPCHEFVFDPSVWRLYIAQDPSDLAVKRQKQVRRCHPTVNNSVS